MNKDSAIKFINESIYPQSKVLEIGCGNGDLLYFLKNSKNTNNKGLEVDSNLASTALGRGISVIHGDVNKDLSFYSDNSFDYVILRKLLQATNDPAEVLQQIFRISKNAIVEIPNFAYFKNRFHLGIRGKMPVSKFLPYQWHDTPNIHFCSINDFMQLCLEKNIKVTKKAFFARGKKINPISSLFPNLMAQYVIFVLSKK